MNIKQEKVEKAKHDEIPKIGMYLKIEASEYAPNSINPKIGKVTLYLDGAKYIGIPKQQNETDYLMVQKNTIRLEVQHTITVTCFSGLIPGYSAPIYYTFYPSQTGIHKLEHTNLFGYSAWIDVLKLMCILVGATLLCYCFVNVMMFTMDGIFFNRYVEFSTPANSELQSVYKTVGNKLEFATGRLDRYEQLTNQDSSLQLTHNCGLRINSKHIKYHRHYFYEGTFSPSQCFLAFEKHRLVLYVDRRVTWSVDLSQLTMPISDLHLSETGELFLRDNQNEPVFKIQ